MSSDFWEPNFARLFILNSDPRKGAELRPQKIMICFLDFDFFVDCEFAINHGSGPLKLRVQNGQIGSVEPQV